MTFIVLDPRQPPSARAVTPAKRLATLSKKRLGVLWNNRLGAEELLNCIAELLREKHDLAEIYFTKKTYIGNPAPVEIINALASRVDAVVVGVGD